MIERGPRRSERTRPPGRPPSTHQRGSPYGRVNAARRPRASRCPVMGGLPSWLFTVTYCVLGALFVINVVGSWVSRTWRDQNSALTPLLMLLLAAITKKRAGKDDDDESR